MKSARNQLDILSAYRELGSYRAAAALCGTTHRTVRHVVERQGQPPVERPPRPKTTDPLGVLIADRVRATDGRISAKRLLPTCRAAGYTGSARHLRRAVATAKADWRRDRRVYRPWQPVPGEHLAIDWGSEGGLHVFCAVLPWSRWRFVRFALDETQATTLALLAECFGAEIVISAAGAEITRHRLVGPGGDVPHRWPLRRPGQDPGAGDPAPDSGRDRLPWAGARRRRLPAGRSRGRDVAPRP